MVRADAVSVSVLGRELLVDRGQHNPVSKPPDAMNVGVPAS